MYTAIKLFGRNKINFITVFSNKIPEVAVNTVNIDINIDYTILGQVCTVSTAHQNIVGIITNMFVLVFAVINWHDENKNNLKTTEAQNIFQKLKNNEPRPKFSVVF